MEFAKGNYFSTKFMENSMPLSSSGGDGILSFVAGPRGYGTD
jgi:hypothetical protein